MPVPGLSEAIAIGRIVWSGVTGGVKFWRRRKRHLTPQETLAARARWKPTFTEWLQNQSHNELRTDVIIRDIKRMDNYPDVGEKSKGISAWFRSGIVDTYEKGILLGLRTVELKHDTEKGGFYFPPMGERGDVKLTFCGFVPYENIESVDWDGDQYYGYPHIYCYFDGKDNQPYERLGFCERRQLDDHIYYTEIVSIEKVERETKKRGVKKYSF
jgi:hypothetical protein